MALAELTMKPFGPIEPERILAQDELFLVALDKFPVSPGHTLIIVKRLVSRFSELAPEEKARMTHWIDWCQGHLDRTLKPKPDAYNIGINDGAAAGQTGARRGGSRAVAGARSRLSVTSSCPGFPGQSA